MRQTNLGAFFGGSTSKKPLSLAEKKGVDSNSLKRTQPTVDDIESEFSISKDTKKAAEQSNVLFNVALIPPKVNLITPEQAKKLNSIENDNYRPDKDCVFSLEYVKPRKDKKGKTLPNFAPFSVIADTFDILGEIKGKNSKGRKKEIISRLVQSFIIHAPQEVEEFFMFASCRLDADYIQPDLGIGKEMMLKACAAILNIQISKFRAGVKKEGDLGSFVEKNKSGSSVMANFLGQNKTKKKNEGISLAQVMKSLRDISSISGSIAKSMAFGELIKACSANQAKYVIRYVKGNLKIGASEKSFIEAIGVAFCEHYGKTNFEEWEHSIRRAINAHPNFRKIIRTLLECDGDVSKVEEKCKMTPGVPCKPMLAKPTKGISIIFQRFENKKFTCEFKYDGLRGQLHYKNGDVQLFSRNLENMTTVYPDILKLLKEKIDPSKASSFIADSEIVAYDVANNRILPFQVLMSRKKKAVDLSSLKCQVCLFVFDMIYLNGECLLDKTFRERRKTMMEHIPVVKGQLEYVNGIDSEDTHEIQKFLEQSVERKFEVIKAYSLILIQWDVKGS